MIASLLREIAIYFDLDGDRHRALAYDKAAKSIEAANGLQRLLESYAASGRVALTCEHVHVHELALAGRWYRDAVARPRGEGHPPEETPVRLTNAGRWRAGTAESGDRR